MKTRSAEVKLTYNGQNITIPMGQFQTSFSYTDNASGESDSIDINIQDTKKDWLNAMPTKGASITAVIRVNDWHKEGDNQKLDCGVFVLDDFSFSGPPTTGTISAVSVPAASAFKETKRSKTWEAVTIAEIAKTIAATAGIGFVFDAAASFALASIEQSKETDCEFLYKLCETYGLSMKVFNSKIIIFDREAYKAKAYAGRIDLIDMESWSWKTTIAGTYTGGEITYTDPNTEEDITFQIGAGSRILECSEKADSAADAERKLVAAIDNANHGSTSMSVSTMGDVKYVAGQTVIITGLGKCNGKYYIDKATHDLGSGYKTDYELSRVEQTAEEAVKDALSLLMDAGVINSPAYWLAHYNDIEHLGTLILKLAYAIKMSIGGSGITNAADAIAVLVAVGIINSPDYWLKNYKAVTYLDQLLINAANAVKA